MIKYGFNSLGDFLVVHVTTGLTSYARHGGFYAELAAARPGVAAVAMLAFENPSRGGRAKFDRLNLKAWRTGFLVGRGEVAA